MMLEHKDTSQLGYLNTLFLLIKDIHRWCRQMIFFTLYHSMLYRIPSIGKDINFILNGNLSGKLENHMK